MAQIVTTTVQVFNEEGYQGGASSTGQLLFERASPRATSLAREGLVRGFYGAQTICRVRVELVSLSNTKVRVQCKAIMVSGGGDPFLQDEVPFANARRGPYQRLLNSVAKKLQ